MHVVMEKSVFRWQRGWVTASLGVWAGTLCGRLVDILHGRTVVERATTLHERPAVLGTLHESAVLHARAKVGNLRERAGGAVAGQTCTPCGGAWYPKVGFLLGETT